ncbi:MAG: TVP38/TMEM64 family protein, partial [Spirochaetota bacterium]
MSKSRRRLAAVLPIVILLAFFTAGMLVPGIRDSLTKPALSRLIEEAGVWGPLVVVSLMAVAIIISPLPNVPISAVTGMIYGPFAGTALAVTGAIMGASGAF